MVKRATLAVLALVLSGCASTPLPQAQADHQPVAVDEAGFWQVMQREEEKLAVSAARERDPALQQYLDALTCTLADDLCGDIRVYVLRSPYFNAFMAPNGMMVVFTGLLLRCEDEAQLAFVLAHEIAHYRARHSLSNWRRTKNTANVLTALGILSGVGSGGGAGYAVGLLGAYLDLARFSRVQEAEADAAAAQSVRAAGYALQPAARLWEGVHAEEQANPRGALSAIFATHPASPERIAALQAAAAEHAGGGTGAERWWPLARSWQSAWLEDELARRNHAQTAVLLDRLQQRATQAGALHYARAELLRQRARPGDLERAATAYREALADTGAPPETARQLGLVLQRLGDRAGAQAALRAYLQQVPDAPDRLLIERDLQ